MNDSNQSNKMLSLGVRNYKVQLLNHHWNLILVSTKLKYIVNKY